MAHEKFKNRFEHLLFINLYKIYQIPAYRLKHGKFSNEHVFVSSSLKALSKYTGTHWHKLIMLSMRQIRTQLLRLYGCILCMTSVSLSNRHRLCWTKKGRININSCKICKWFSLNTTSQFTTQRRKKNP